MKNILIAEDSSVIQNLTRKILQIQNYKIFSAKNGQQVLKLIDKEDIDVILMDINMPIMDGMECAKQIRALDDEKKKNTPILAITGNAKNYSIEDFKSVGINEYLQKPLDFDALVELVRKYSQ